MHCKNTLKPQNNYFEKFKIFLKLSTCAFTADEILLSLIRCKQVFLVIF